jgi:hypothetical protein
VIRSDSQQRIGVLILQIVDGDSGAVLSQSTRQVLARDVSVREKKGLLGSRCFSKRIELDQGFYVQLFDCGAATREEIDGFGFTPGRSGHNFSWEWFDVTSNNHAVKRQESGELTFMPVWTGSTWELGRIEVKKEISLRVFGLNPVSTFRNAPSWRIQVKEGSYVEWPSAIDGVAVLHSFPTPTDTQQIVNADRSSRTIGGVN